MLCKLRDLWAGRLPLTVAFWNYTIFWGFLLNAGATLAALVVLVAAGGSGEDSRAAWLAAVMHVLPIPWGVLCLVGVWRSAGSPAVGPKGRVLARVAASIWTAVTLIA